MLARHGKVAHNEAVGYLDLDTKRPMPTDAILRIASMTKPITSVAVMMLWEQGKLKLDDPVAKHIPAFKFPTVLESTQSLEATKPAINEITIRHLLTHTSGLSYEFVEPLGALYHKHGIHCGSCTVNETLEDMINKLGPLPLRFNPGQEWHYGMNYAVLGRIVEVVSRMPFDQYVEQQICQPLRMHDTHFKVPKAKLDRLVAAYVPSGDSIRKLKDGEMLNWNLTDLGGGDILMSCDYPYSEANKCVLGGGNICSTPGDYMRFCQMLLNEGELDGVRLLRADTVKMMTANQVGDLRGEEGYGFGFGITPDTADTPEQLRGSYYWYGGWTTSFRIAPQGDWILVTMSQVAWNDLTPKWFAEYEQIAAVSIID
jgi:CubicO group peptidase (beta-lactamase class C family)